MLSNSLRNNFDTSITDVATDQTDEISELYGTKQMLMKS